MAKENKTEQPAKQPQGIVYNLIRRLLLFGMVAFLLWTLAKDNPKFRAYFDRFTKAQQMVDPDAILSIGGQTMGTFYSVKIAIVPKGWDGARLHKTVAEVLDRVDTAMSTYKDDSQVSRFNASRSTDWFPVSEETAKVVSLALEMSKITGGAFDITVAPVVNLWKFGPDKAPLSDFPPDETIQTVLTQCGWEKLSVRMEPESALKKNVPELSIDLSGIAKGYAVDAVAEALEKEGLENYLIDIGGEVRSSGVKRLVKEGSAASMNYWTLGIEKPIPSHDGAPKIYRFARPGTGSLATSGGGRNFSVLAGKRFSHIINPKTGRPTEIRDANAERPEFEAGSVSVFDPSCAKADALATGLFVLGPEAGKKLADANGWPVLYISRSTSDPDLFSETASTAFAAVESFRPEEITSQLSVEPASAP